MTTGWSLQIDLTETALEGRPFEQIDGQGRSPDDWIRCWREGSVFHAAGGAMNLTEMISSFRQWAETG